MENTNDKLRDEFHKFSLELARRQSVGELPMKYIETKLADWWLDKLEERERIVREEEKNRINLLVALALEGETISGMANYKLQQVFSLSPEENISKE
jgi:hypothetical protein